MTDDATRNAPLLLEPVLSCFIHRQAKLACSSRLPPCLPGQPTPFSVHTLRAPYNSAMQPFGSSFNHRADTPWLTVPRPTANIPQHLSITSIKKKHATCHFYRANAIRTRPRTRVRACVSQFFGTSPQPEHSTLTETTYLDTDTLYRTSFPPLLARMHRIAPISCPNSVSIRSSESAIKNKSTCATVQIEAPACMRAVRATLDSRFQTSSRCSKL